MGPLFLCITMKKLGFSNRIRMEHVERQLASLTGLVQTALTGSSTAVAGGSAAAAPVVAPPVAVPSTSTVAERILPHHSPAEIINKRETNILIKQFSASPPPHGRCNEKQPEIQALVYDVCPHSRMQIQFEDVELASSFSSFFSPCVGASSAEIERNPFTRNNSTGGTCSSTLATGTANRLAAPKLGKGNHHRLVPNTKQTHLHPQPFPPSRSHTHTDAPTQIQTDSVPT